MRHTGLSGDEFARRQFLQRTLASVAGGLALALVPGEHAGAAVRLGADPFTLGIASGDPTPYGIVLWTRLAPDPLNGGGMPDRAVPVAWQLATDAAMRRVVRRGTAMASPALAHSVHVEIGGLTPGREYFYRFSYAAEESPIGRFRTTLTAGTRQDRFRFAFGTCQAWDQGYYTLYRDMLDRDIDVMFHLGDYIYEYPILPNGGVRAKVLPPRHYREITTLEDYRDRYALYKTDPDLQAAHAAFPFVNIWDDHEVENNYADEVSEDNAPRAQFLARRAAAYQANYEHLPFRQAQRPQGPDLRLYRRLRFGDLAEFSMLDTRQYRDDHPCGDGIRETCGASRAASVQMLGATQERWLLDGLGRSTARWNVIANGIIMGALDFKLGAGRTQDQDTWDGYAGARRRVLQGIVDRDVRNPVVIAGDYHPTFVNNLKVDFFNTRSPVMAAEFVAPALTTEGDTMNYDDDIRPTLPELPHIEYFNGRRHGYFLASLGREQLDMSFRTVPTVTLNSAPVRREASFVVENGRPGVQLDT